MRQTERERVFLLKELPVGIEEIEPITIRVEDFFDSNSSDALKIKQKRRKFPFGQKRYEQRPGKD